MSILAIRTCVISVITYYDLKIVSYPIPFPYFEHNFG